MPRVAGQGGGVGAAVRLRAQWSVCGRAAVGHPPAPLSALRDRLGVGRGLPGGRGSRASGVTQSRGCRVLPDDASHLCVPEKAECIAVQWGRCSSRDRSVTVPGLPHRRFGRAALCLNRKLGRRSPLPPPPSDPPRPPPPPEPPSDPLPQTLLRPPPRPPSSPPKTLPQTLLRPPLPPPSPPAQAHHGSGGGGGGMFGGCEVGDGNGWWRGKVGGKVLQCHTRSTQHRRLPTP